MCVGDARPEESTSGFTLVELLVTLVIIAIVMGMGAVGFAEYQARTAARRAAELFSRDLSLARSTALRSRIPVVIRFDEAGRTYETQPQGDDVLVTRSYDGEGDLELDALDLQLDGDSILFTSRGFADLSGVNGSVGTASFTAGPQTYRVVFNTAGAARIEEP